MNARSAGLLDDLKVLDLSQFIPGPYATRLLSDQGAARSRWSRRGAIKVEPPRGDALRSLLCDGALDNGKDALSLVYQTLNRLTSSAATPPVTTFTPPPTIVSSPSARWRRNSGRRFRRHGRARLGGAAA